MTSTISRDFFCFMSVKAVQLLLGSGRSRIKTLFGPTYVQHISNIIIIVQCQIFPKAFEGK